MKTRILVASESDPNEAVIREAAQALADGALVVFPTETVYGVGARATSRSALESLHQLKVRPADKPFTLHLAEVEDAERFAGRLPAIGERLIRKTWPGPLALVVPDRRGPTAKQEELIEEYIYKDGTVGLRCPSHRVGRAILRAAGVPVAASSANLAGHPPPQQASEAVAELDGHVALIVDAGRTPYARPSTVVQVWEDGSYKVLREGAITSHRVQRLARTRILLVCTANVCRSPMAVGLAKQMMAKRFGCEPEELEARGIEVHSCGTAASADLEASPNAVS